MCQNCAKLIDSDEPAYSTTTLRLWKALAEDRAARLLGVPQPAVAPSGPPSPTDRAVAAIANNVGNLLPSVKAALTGWVAGLVECASTITARDAAQIQSALRDSRQHVREFTRLARTGAEYGAHQVSGALLAGVAELAKHGDVPPTCRAPYYQFLTHEAILILSAEQLKCEHWEALKSIAKAPVFIESPSGQLLPAKLAELRCPPSFLGMQEVSAGRVLQDLWSSESATQAHQDLVAADYVLYLATAMRSGQDPLATWHPIAASQLERSPRLIQQCQSRAFVDEVKSVFGSDTVDSFRASYAKARVPGNPGDPKLRFTLLEAGKIGSIA